MLSLCLIVKASDDEALLLDKALEATHKNVDEICITITGQNKACEDVCKKYKANISYFDWIDDFSAARTFNFSQAKGDWILWMDADDTFKNLELLKETTLTADQAKVKGLFLPYEYKRDENGNLLEWHYKLQAIKNDGTFTWKGSIHEDLLSDSQPKLAREDKVIRVHNSNVQRGLDSFERNLRILLKDLQAQGENPDPRTLYYLGHTLVALNDLEKATAVLEEYLERSGWDEERYQARLLLGELAMKNEDYDKAIKYYHDAILEREDYPDAYLLKGQVYVKKQDWKKAITNLNIGLKQKRPESTIIHYPMNESLLPLQSLAYAYIQTGKLDEAKEIIKRAYQLDPKNKNTRDLASLCQHLHDKRDTAKAYLSLTKKLISSKEFGKIEQLLRSVPKDIQSNEIINKLFNDFLPARVWESNEIAIYCPRSVEFWAPPSLNKGGIGGSETAVIWLSKELTKLGKKVTVYNFCGTYEGEYDGVTYKNYWEFNWNDKFNILISWRYPELFDLGIDAKLRVLDLHDVMSPADLPEDRVKNIDKIFVKTNYHRTLYPKVPDEKFVVISNGIDLNRFNGELKRKPFRLIYSSTPNRGLDIILKHWGKIKEEIPEAELHVYYGWKTYYEIEKNNPSAIKWMKKVQAQMNQEGIIDHGRVGQDELAKSMMESDAWLYPTYFPEINCITALENQAAGCIPITTSFAALQETISPEVKKIDGDIYLPAKQEEWLNLVIKTLKDSSREDLRNKLKDFSSEYSWENIAQQWDNNLK